MTVQQNLQSNTQRLAALINKNDVLNEQELNVAKQCLIDYISCGLAAKNELIIKKFREQFEVKNQSSLVLGGSVSTPERAALINGFTTHYVDLDDVQSNLRGHPSVVIYSALLAIAHDSDYVSDFFMSYVIGVEIVGLLGEQLNPKHKLDGYHTTATIGVIGAVAAIAKLRKLSLNDTIKIISFAADQSAGLGIESGTDNKPLHAGLSARNAIYAYQFVKSGVSTNLDILNNTNGWNKTVVAKDLDLNLIEQQWCTPGQILKPGIWFKQHQFCSAAMSGYDAAKLAYQAGIRFADVAQIVTHFRKDEDRVLRYQTPKNGQQGKFSIEYIVWQVLENGDVNDSTFKSDFQTTKFITQSKGKFVRVNDLTGGNPDTRITKLEIRLTNGNTRSFLVTDPVGSPKKQPSLNDSCGKLSDYIKKSNSKLDIKSLLSSLNNQKMEQMLAILRTI